LINRRDWLYGVGGLAVGAGTRIGRAAAHAEVQAESKPHPAREKIRRFTREILYVPGQNVLSVFDRVVSNNSSFRKAWLLHGVNQPSVEQDGPT